MALSADLFDYPLPAELIAQTPAARRDESRLLVVDRASRTLRHTHFSELPSFLSSGDRLFRNNVSVLPARLAAARPTGGKVECFLLQESGAPNRWRCLLKPGRKLAPGATFSTPLAGSAFHAEILSRDADSTALVQFTTPGDEPIAAIAGRSGDIPLPPYIARPDSSRRESDCERYQTIYADPSRSVAVAAPTAGLHFTPAVFERLAARGVRIHDLTLHVGLGTFRPLSTPNVEEHRIHREIYEIPAETQAALFAPRTGRRIAVGTTTVRSVEDFLSREPPPPVRNFVAEASIFLFPPRPFKGVDALITNFHQPRSTLLCLVAAFLDPGGVSGIPWIKEIYAEAVALRYRFLSYGDAMLIL